MKTLEISSYKFFEFETSKELAQNVLQDVLETKLHYTSNAGPTHPNKEKFGKTGYKQLEDGSITFYHHKELFDYVQTCFDKVAEIYLHDSNLTICDAWVTQTKFGQLSDLHVHKVSHFSGLYYLTDQQGSETVFHLEDPVYEFLHPLYGSHVIKENKMTYVSKAEQGKLLIWPSFIKHSVNIHREKNVRYSLAFNAFIDGPISLGKSRMLKTKTITPGDNITFNY